MNYLKKNGGILFIRYLVVGNALCYIYICQAFSQKVIFDSKQDSCYCYNNFLTLNVKSTYSVPEQDITSVSGSIANISQNIRQVVLRDIPKDTAIYLLMTIYVDKEGQVRCASMDKGNHKDIAIEVFHLWKKQDLIPASQRGTPVHYWLFFAIRADVQKNVFP